MCQDTGRPPGYNRFISTAERFRRVREDHSRETAEDYVELIQALTDEHGEARAVDLATRLGVSQVTVTKTIQRLMRDGLVTTQPYRAVFLTEEGQRMAHESRRRHEIVVGFLLALGVGEVTAETDAEGIEHHVSEETLAAMERFVGR